MSGHSKWKNIAHRKGKQDATRAQLFTRLCRDIYASARRGGGNPDTNYFLKMAIDKAKTASVPSDTINRTLAKALGTLEGVTYEDFMYEGYGAGGVAFLLELSSDNRNRTAAEIRHLFSKQGGSLGESGCVMWMFKRVGELRFAKDSMTLQEDDFTLAILEAGADDYQEQDDEWVVYTSPDLLNAVDQAMRDQGLPCQSIGIAYVPTTTTEVTDEEIIDKVETLLFKLEEHDDVQGVYMNAVFAEGTIS